MPKKIAFFEVEEWEKESLRKAFGKEDLSIFESKLDDDSLKKIRNVEVLAVFIYSKITKDVLKRLPKLKLIVTQSTGFDHIDLKACREKNITVCNVPFYGENTVAEHTFALILSLSRNVHKAFVRTLTGNFSLEGLRGFDLKDKTIGIIGAGHIGLHVIKMAKGFGMHVLAFDMHKDTFLEEVLHFRYTELDELLRKSDIISLHAPFNKHTKHLINKKNINKIKKGAILINTSRGGLVETEALVKALDTGRIGGAGLDVLEDEDLIKEERQLLSKDFSKEKLERLVKEHILLHRENVVITPHIAFNSNEALKRILDTTIDNINNFFKKKPENVVS